MIRAHATQKIIAHPDIPAGARTPPNFDLCATALVRPKTKDGRLRPVGFSEPDRSGVPRALAYRATTDRRRLLPQTHRNRCHACPMPNHRPSALVRAQSFLRTVVGCRRSLTDRNFVLIGVSLTPVVYWAQTDPERARPTRSRECLPRFHSALT